MPYLNEFANKSSHFDIIKSKEIQDFLSESNYLKNPDEKSCEEMCSGFIDVPNIDCFELPSKIIATDGSFYESSINRYLPSTKVGYIKIGCMLIDLEKFNSIKIPGTKFVDPFKVAELQDDNSSLTFPMPSANILTGGKDNVVDSFRYNTDKLLLKYRTNEKNYKTSLRSTLFKLSSYRPESDQNNSNLIYLHRCPKCNTENIQLKDIEEQQFCNECKNELYPSDCLRLWEEVSEYQSNGGPISRFMMVLEHIMPIHYIRMIEEYNSDSSASIFNNLSFIVDGPLAIFGTAAWLHRCIMKYLYSINKCQLQKGLNEILFVGIQKTGQLVEYTELISKYIKSNTIFPVDDDYRYKYIAFSRNPSKNGFGFETYYGQDFIYTSKTKRHFVFSLPFPFYNKDLKDKDFNTEKIVLSNYNSIARAIKLIDKFECDLYKNAIIPVALAHKYTAISLKPGSKVLDLLTIEGLKRD